jgi:DNA-binding LacI/PurR family transcriptional regulator
MHIAFVSSALTPDGPNATESFDFFALLLGGIVERADESDIRVSVYIPRKRSPTTSNQREVLMRVLRDADDFNAIVIAPFAIDEIRGELEKFFIERTTKKGAKQKPPKPIVFIDKVVDFDGPAAPSEADFLLKSIGCNNADGGREAARILCDLFAERGVEDAHRRLMVLAGLEGSQDRVRGFVERARELAPDMQLVAPTSEHLNFTRRGARRWMLDQMKALKSGDPSDFGILDPSVSWGIFACNDEMALGVRSVVSNRYRQLRAELLDAHFSTGRLRLRTKPSMRRNSDLADFLENIKIVGFDGIGPAIDLIDPTAEGIQFHHEPDPWLVGTIRAHVEQQSVEAIDWIRLYREDWKAAANSRGTVIVDISSVAQSART